MIDKNKFKNAFAEALVNAGFVKKSNSWYLSGEDAIVVLNLQKSDHGDYYYLNVGISLKVLSDQPFPKENHCHIQMRADNLVKSEEVHLLCLGMHLEEGGEADLSITTRLLKQEILPLTDEFLTLEQLREHYKKSTFKASLIFWKARDLLEQ